MRTLSRLNRNQPLEVLLHTLNPAPRGWCTYFQPKVSSATFAYLRAALGGAVIRRARAATIPWTAYLAVTLPDRARSHNYRVAWVGFDVLLVVVLLLTAYVAWRGRPLVGLFAASAATMLIVTPTVRRLGVAAEPGAVSGLRSAFRRSGRRCA